MFTKIFDFTKALTPKPKEWVLVLFMVLALCGIGAIYVQTTETNLVVQDMQEQTGIALYDDARAGIIKASVELGPNPTIAEMHAWYLEKANWGPLFKRAFANDKIEEQLTKDFGEYISILKSGL